MDGAILFSTNPFSFQYLLSSWMFYIFSLELSQKWQKEKTKVTPSFLEISHKLSFQDYCISTAD